MGFKDNTCICLNWEYEDYLLTSMRTW